MQSDVWGTVCGGELETKAVEKIVRGGKHTAILNVSAEVCLHCGEKLFAEETVRYFETIRHNTAARNHRFSDAGKFFYCRQ